MKVSCRFFEVLYLLLFFSSFSSAYFVDVSFTVGNIGDKNLCKGGGANYNKGVVELALRRGHSCAEGTQGFDDIYCINPNRDDLMVSLQSGQSSSIHCEVGTNPFEKNGENCVRVTWCNQKGYGDYKDTPKLCRDLNGECDKPGTSKISGSVDCPDTCYEIPLKIKSADGSVTAVLSVFSDSGEEVEAQGHIFSVGDSLSFSSEKSFSKPGVSLVSRLLQLTRPSENHALDSPEDRFSRVYGAPGEYAARVIVTDNLGHVSVDSAELYVGGACADLEDSASCSCSAGYTCRDDVLFYAIDCPKTCCRCVEEKLPGYSRLFDIWAESNPSEKGQETIHAYAGERVYFKPIPLDDSLGRYLFKSFSISVTGPTNLQLDGTTLDSKYSDYAQNSDYVIGMPVMDTAVRIFGLPGNYVATLTGKSRDGIAYTQKIDVIVTCKNACGGETECLPENSWMASEDGELCCWVCTLKKGLAEKALESQLNGEKLPSGCKSVIYQGNSNDKLDLVFIPGIYSTPTEDEKKILLEDFEGMVREYYQTLIGIKPFDAYFDRINIWLVNEVVESCSVDSDGLLTCPQTDAENICPNDRRIYIITNLPGRASAPSPRVYINYNPSKKKVFVHELGHILGNGGGKLDDEYVDSGTYDRWVKNGADMDKYVANSINCDTDTSCSKWTDSSKSSYVEGASCFQNCLYTNAYYRSAVNCIMNDKDVTDAFCSVCSKYIDQYFKELAYLNP